MIRKIKRMIALNQNARTNAQVDVSLRNVGQAMACYSD